jgi:hypothetical protein
MRARGFLVFFAVLLFCGCLIMGCSSLPFIGSPQQETPQHNAGFSFTNITFASPDSIRFDDAISDLTQIEYAGTGEAPLNGTPEKEILYLRGDLVNTTGNANSWMFIVRNQNTTFFVTYSRNGRSISDWPAGFNGTAIPMDTMVPLGDLFDENQTALFAGQETNSTGAWEVIMENGNYTLTSMGTGSSRILVFNATSGVLISSYA